MRRHHERRSRIVTVFLQYHVCFWGHVVPFGDVPAMGAHCVSDGKHNNPTLTYTYTLRLGTSAFSPFLASSFSAQPTVQRVMGRYFSALTPSNSPWWSCLAAHSPDLFTPSSLPAMAITRPTLLSLALTTPSRQTYLPTPSPPPSPRCQTS
jgi:hypothetical protein